MGSDAHSGSRGQLETTIPDDDAGFSLLEVIVAMTLLAILAVATLPLFITGMRVTADDSSRTTATARVGAVIEQARSAPTCAKLQTLAAQNQSTVFTDSRGRALRLTVDPPTCTTGVAAPVTLTVRATDSAGAITLSSATTIIYVTT